MRYKFKIYEDGKEIEDKEAMSFKKLLKSLVIPNSKWTGWIAYKNKKGRYNHHRILNGKRVGKKQQYPLKEHLLSNGLT